MTNIDIIFSRALLQAGLAEVRKFAPETKLKVAWVWHAGRDLWEFHYSPSDFYWCGSAGNAYEARYKGWMAWLHKHGWEGAIEEPAVEDA